LVCLRVTKPVFLTVLVVCKVQVCGARGEYVQFGRIYTFCIFRFALIEAGENGDADFF